MSRRPTLILTPPSRRPDRARASRRALVPSLNGSLLESRLLMVADATRTVLTASAAVVKPGDPLTLTATVTDQTDNAFTPTGYVYFYDGSTAFVQTQLVNGVGTISTANLGTGYHSLHAVYQGNSGFNPSTSGVTATNTISTIAGTGVRGYSGDGGQATAARLNTVSSVAYDAQGNLFIADYDNHVVRKVTTDGVITTIAGTGQQGYSGDTGQATKAQLDGPSHLAVDSAGNLFIAETGNNVVRKVAPDGVITTYAGTGTAGFSGDTGPATSAQLSQPQGVAVDAAGNLFFVDSSNSRVRKVTPGGIITTVAGNGLAGYTGDTGSATSASIRNPLGLAIDAMGNLFIADYGNNVVRKVTAGIITTVAGNGTAGYSGDGSNAITARLNAPQGVTVDAAGNLFIADKNNNVVREVTPDGLITTVAGNTTGGVLANGDGGPASSAQLGDDQDVAIDPSGNLVIADGTSYKVRQVAANLTILVGQAHFDVTGVPTSTIAGQSQTFQVKAINADGSFNSGYSGTVHFSSSDNQASVPADVTFVGGQGVFGVTFRTAGAQSIIATDTVDPTNTGSEEEITVTPAATTHYTVTGGVDAVAGTAQTINVSAFDTYGNLATNDVNPFILASSDTQADLPSNATLTKGMGTFNVVLKTAGNQSIAAISSVDSKISGSQLGINITPGATTQYLVTGGADAVAGTVQTINVSAEDAYGNLVASGNDLINLTSSDSQAQVPVSATLTNGTGTFDVILKTAGSQSITATNPDNPTVTGTQSGITVTPAATSQYLVTGGVDAQAGTPQIITVSAEDAYGNLATDDNNALQISSNDNQAVLPANAALTNGQGTFNVTLKTAGSQTIAARSLVNARVSGTQSGITVTPAATFSYTVTGAVDAVAGTVQTITVSAFDTYGNLATNDVNGVNLSSGVDLLEEPTLFLSKGTATTNVTLRIAGSRTILAQASNDSKVTGTQNDINITPAATSQYLVTGGVNAVAGATQTITVSAVDAYGNIKTSGNDLINLTSSDSQAQVPVSATLTNGTGTFDVILKTAGSQSITATNPDNPTVTGTQTGINITSATADHLSVTGPATLTAGSPVEFVVTARDLYGNIDTSLSDSVDLASSDSQAPYFGGSRLINGMATFTATLKTAGLQTLRTHYLGNGPDDGTLQTNVTAAAASSFRVDGLATATAGDTNNYDVTAIDQYGNVATTYTGIVEASSSDPQAELPPSGTLTNGVGTFGIMFKTAGRQLYSFEDKGRNLGSGSYDVQVQAGALAHLQLGVPFGATAGQSATIGLTGYDDFGNVATGSNAVVNLSDSDVQADFPSSVTLVAGEAVSAFTPKTSGNSLITAIAADDSTINTRSQIQVKAAAATHLQMAVIPGGVAGSESTLTLAALDDYDNLATGYTGTIHFASETDPNAGLPTDATLTRGSEVFRFRFVKAGVNSITATDSANPDLTTSVSGILVTPAAAARLVITGPVSVVAGAPLTQTITAFDVYGNLASGADNTIQFTSTDEAATLPSSVTLVNGLADFTATFNTAGTRAITATDSQDSSITGTLGEINVQAKISGTVFIDSNANGVQDAGELGLAGRMVYLDQNGSGQFVAGDPMMMTDANGHFAFDGVAAGSSVVLQDSSQASSYRQNVSQTTTNADESLNIGLVPFSPIAPIRVLPNPFTGHAAGGPNSQYVQSLYKSVLGRDGSSAEVNGWLELISTGLTTKQVAAGFVNSPEHRTEQVAGYYQSFLHRAPDPSSVYWVNLLVNGVSEQNVVKAFLDSAEYQSSHTDSNLFVRDLYLEVLGRRGSDLEVAAWQSALDAGRSRDSVEAVFVGSAEANDQIVESFYVGSLNRSREGKTSDIWTIMLSKGDAASEVAIGILASDEFTAKAKASKLG